MPTIPQSEIPKPQSWDEFEDIVWDIYSRDWRDPNTERNGRNGQRQHGVDIYGKPSHLNGEYAGIQCKLSSDSKLTENKIKDEIAEAEKFTPPLAEYFIATTEPRDANLQKAVREIDRERRAAGKFSVIVVFWETLTSKLSNPSNNDLLKKHYGDWINRSLSIAKQIEVIGELNTLLVQAQREFRSLISLVRPQEEHVKREILEATRTSKEVLFNFFDEKRLYLDEDICTKMEKFLQKLEQIWTDYYLSQVYNHTKDFEAAARMSRGFKVVTEEIPKLRQEIELEFRRVTAK